MQFEWEEIYIKSNSAADDTVTRAKVFNGWLVRNSIVMTGNQIVTITFVKDVHHEWIITKDN
jgi:hypothetical protein